MKIRLAIFVRVLGFLLGGIVAVVAAVALLLWASFDAEHTGQALTRYFKDGYQRTLQLSQPPELVLWPRPALSLTRVALSEPGRNETFASANTLRLNLAIWPLLQRRFELQGLNAKGLSARLVRNPKSEWNFNDLLETSAPPGLAEWSLAPSSIVIEGARLAIETPNQTGKLILSAVDLQASLPANRQAGSLTWQAVLAESSTTTELKLRGRARLTDFQGLNAGSIENLRMGIDGNSHALKGTSASIEAEQLQWRQHGKAGGLSALEITLHGAAGAQSVDFSATSPTLGWQGMGWQGQNLKARLALRTVSSQREFTLELPTLNPDATQGFNAADALWRWQYQAGAQNAQQGQLKLSLRADLTRPSLHASQFSGELSLQHPRLQASASQAKLKGKFTLQSGASEFTLKTSLGEDSLTSKGRLATLWPLVGRFEMSSESLDLDRLLLPATPGKTPPAFEWPELGQHELNGQLKLARLRIGGMIIHELSSPLQIGQGQLKAENFSAKLHTGTLSGKLQADPAARRISVQGDILDLPLERIALETDLPIPLSGKLSGSYRLSTLITPESSALSNLEGAVRWKLSAAGLRGLDLQRSLKELAPAISSGQMSARSPGRDEATELGTASSRFVFAQGQLSTDKIETHSNWLKLTGSGQADLPRGEMDFRLQAQLLPAASRELASLRGKPLPLRIKGPLMHPDLRYESTPPRLPATAAQKK